MKSKLCMIDIIRNRLKQIDSQVEEFILYQNRMLSRMYDECEFSDEQKQELESLLLEKYLDGLPF